MKFTSIAGLGLLVLAASVHAGKTVEYRQDTTVLEGYVGDFTPAAGKRVPAVLVFHAWKGIGDQERKVVDSLSQAGVVAFAADIYGKGVRPSSPAEAGKTAGSFRQNRTLLRERALAGLAQVKKFAGVDSSRIVAIGFCFGGTTALELTRTGASLAGAVSFHGGLDSPDPTVEKKIKSPILLLHGADDPHVKREDLQTMRKNFDAAGVNWTLVEFSKAVHSFTDPGAGSDPSKGAAFDAREAREAWMLFAAYFEAWTGKK